MKITTRLVIDLKTNEVLEHDYYEYTGSLALCDGGDGGDGGDGDSGSIGGEGADTSGEGIGMGADAVGGTAGIGTGTGDIGGMAGGVGGSTGGEGTSSGAPDGDTGSLGSLSDAEAEAAAQSNVDAQTNSMSPEVSVDIGTPSVSAVVGAIAAALSGNPVAGLAGIVGSIASNSSISSTDPSQDAALGALSAAGLGVPAGFGGETGLGGFGSDIGDNYGGPDGGPGDSVITPPTQDANPKPPEPNPPVENPGGGTGEGTGIDPDDVEQNLLEERRRRNAVGWLDMLHEGEGENPVYTPTAFEPEDKKEAVAKATDLPSWLDTEDEREKFYSGLFTEYGI